MAPTQKPITINVTMRNRWTYFDCDPDDQVELKKLFRYHPLNYEQFTSYQDKTWDGWANMLQRGRVATGLLEHINSILNNRTKLQELGVDLSEFPKVPYSFKITRDIEAPKFRSAAPSDREYQNTATEEMIAHSYCGGLILSATGTGKTRIASYYFMRLIGNGCFIVDDRGLLEQTRRVFASVLNEKIGVVGNSKFDPQRITAATVQTLARNLKNPKFAEWFKSLDVLLIDEFHTAMNNSYESTIRHIKPLAVFGFTATLDLHTPHIWMNAVALAGPPIFEYPIERGVEEGYLSQGSVCFVNFRNPRRFGPSYETINIKGERVTIAAGSPQATYRANIVRNAERNRAICAIVRQGWHYKRRMLLLVETKLHLRLLSDHLKDIPHVVLSGEIKGTERIDALKKMDAGLLDLILATRVLAKGADVETLDLIIDATGLPSQNNAAQRYGRGTRLSAGKTLLHVDISDVGGFYEKAARSRAAAFANLNIPTRTIDWRKDPREVFDVEKETT